jgi:hypothetical protein
MSWSEMAGYELFSSSTFTTDAKYAAAMACGVEAPAPESPIMVPSAGVAGAPATAPLCIKRKASEEKIVVCSSPKKPKTGRDITGGETEEEEEEEEEKEESKEEASVPMASETDEKSVLVRQCIAYTLLEYFAQNVVKHMKARKCSLAKAAAEVVRSLEA